MGNRNELTKITRLNCPAINRDVVETFILPDTNRSRQISVPTIFVRIKTLLKPPVVLARMA